MQHAAIHKSKNSGAGHKQSAPSTDRHFKAMAGKLRKAMSALDYDLAKLPDGTEQERKDKALWEALQPRAIYNTLIFLEGNKNLITMRRIDEQSPRCNGEVRQKLRALKSALKDSDLFGKSNKAAVYHSVKDLNQCIKQADALAGFWDWAETQAARTPQVSHR